MKKLNWKLILIAIVAVLILLIFLNLTVSMFVVSEYTAELHNETVNIKVTVKNAALFKQYRGNIHYRFSHGKLISEDGTEYSTFTGEYEIRDDDDTARIMWINETVSKTFVFPVIPEPGVYDLSFSFMGQKIIIEDALTVSSN